MNIFRMSWNSSKYLFALMESNGIITKTIGKSEPMESLQNRMKIINKCKEPSTKPIKTVRKFSGIQFLFLLNIFSISKVVK